MDSRSALSDGLAPALGDDVIDRAAQHGARRLEAPVFRRRQPVGESERPEALADVLIDDRPGLIDRRRERTEVGAEQRADARRSA